MKLHENYLSDTNFISADESTENSTMESEVLDKPVVSKRGRKRGNQDSDEKKPSISSKKAKKAKKESIERTLNSTFSVDEDEEVNDTTITLPAVVAKPIKSTIRKLRGKKKTEAAYLTEESSINESETEKTPISQAVNKKPAKLAMNMKPQPTNSRDCRIPVVMLKQLESTKQTSSDDSEPEKNRAKKPFTQAEPQSLENETTAKKIPPKKLKKSSSTASVRKTPTIEQEMKKAPLKRTRSSTGNKAELVGEQISIEETKEMPAKKLEKSVSNETPAASPQVEPCVPSPTATAVAVVEIEKKTVLRRTSTHQLRSRISTINIPAKIAMTPVASAKRGVHFTAKNGNASSAISTNISKANKPKAAPNFAEIHQKNFLKMQSVDEYVEKKRARTETMTATSAKTNRTKSVLNNTFTPQAKPAVAKPIQASTPSDSTMNNMKFNFVSGKAAILYIFCWKYGNLYIVGLIFRFTKARFHGQGSSSQRKTASDGHSERKSSQRIPDSSEDNDDDDDNRISC